MDQMYLYLMKTEINNESTLLHFVQYIEDEEYDTDSLKIDVDYASTSNIDENIRNNQVIPTIQDFIKAATS